MKKNNQKSEVKPFHALVATTGESPQVVTETLYGIHKQGLPWPDRLIILTTSIGKEKAESGLLKKPNESTRCMLDQCCIDLGHEPFSTEFFSIQVIPDHNGKPIDDARTKDDQEALADYIVKTIAKLCDVPQCLSLHASIAGGRKTMTFFLGYAMSLFARANDRLSHVLIAPAKYEKLIDFYYPTPYEKAINDKGGNTLDTSEDNVNVMLADIPFIRQRDQLKQSVLTRFSNPDEHLTYRQLVQLQQLALCKDPYRDIRLDFDLAQRTIALNYKDEHVLTIHMDNKPLELAYFAMIARHNNVTSAQRYHRERANNKDYWPIYRTAYLQELWQIVYPELTPYQEINIFEYWSDMYKKNADNLNLEKTINGLKEETPTFFDDRKKLLRKHLKQALPDELLSIIEPAPVFYYKKENSGNKQPNKDIGNFRDTTTAHLQQQDVRSKLLGLQVSSNLCPLDVPHQLVNA